MSFEFSLSLPETNEVKKEYDLVILGGGPAGCSAAIYAKRYALDTLMVSRDFGGLIADAEIVDNYPGLPEVTGSELGDKFYVHAKKYGVDTKTAEVESISKNIKGYLIKLSSDETIQAETIIIAVGEKHRKLNVKGEEEFLGKGVSYCAICDAPLFKGKTTAVIGGGNTAFMDAQILAKHASKVVLIHRRNWFRADPIEVQRVKQTDNIEILTPYIVKEIKGGKKVEKLVLEKTEEREGKVYPTGEQTEVPVDGVFVDIGLIPNTEFLSDSGIKLDERGYIVVDDNMATNLPGVFAAGDCTDKASKFRQVVLAAAQGAVAATSAYNFLRQS